MAAELTGSSVTAVLRKLDDRIGEHERGSALAAGLTLEGVIKTLLSQPGTGRVYRRGGRVHQASAPGNPPAVDTGELRNSVGTEQQPDGSVEVGTRLAKAVPLEFGAPERGLLPRPFMRPAVLQARQAMADAALTWELRATSPAIGAVRESVR